ncbi:hypothetical protein, partial [Streptomyces xylophagus]
GYPTRYGPKVHCFTPTSIEYVAIDSTSDSRLYITAEFSDWTELSGGWVSVRASLRDMNGWTIGRRPALIYNRPYDVPSTTSFYLPQGGGMFALNTRVYS